MTIYYVRTDGNDANTGLTNSAGGAWRTPRFASRSLAPGDTLRFVNTNGGSGTEFVETAGPAIDYNSATAGGFGSSWDPSQAITIEANSGDEGLVVLKRDTASGTGVCTLSAFSAAANVQFVQFRNLIFDGVKNSTGLQAFLPVYVNGLIRTDNTVHDIRFYGCECKHSAQGSGLFQESTTTAGAGVPYNLLFTKDPVTGRQGKLTDNGLTSLQHGMYLQGRDNEVSHTEVSGSAGLGIQIHRDSSGADNCKNIYIHHVWVHDCTATGIYYGRGSGGKIANCKAHDNSTGIRVDDGATSWKVLNCTSVRNTTANFATAVTAAVGAGTFTNLVARKLGVTTNNWSDNGASVTITTCTNVAVADTDATDPKFADPSNDDFQLQADSPCRDTGTDTSADGVTDDFDGNPRSQYDQGAYEYSTVSNVTTHYDVSFSR